MNDGHASPVFHIYAIYQTWRSEDATSMVLSDRALPHVSPLITERL